MDRTYPWYIGLISIENDIAILEETSPVASKVLTQYTSNPDRRYYDFEYSEDTIRIEGSDPEEVWTELDGIRK